ncbi:hypothetical protein BDV26DRAFT_257016 [Aspergillus bertholletiae]|uniref:CFEM domain-containing protein n=1 Tax=Aspergillus bertholletiae TaxID=1226010 RepID=A0A5N7BFU2_9EURO|nr:hypothetical protein BDV26DRAFT_257016 [Aspergillus bertholletiae]
MFNILSLEPHSRLLLGCYTSSERHHYGSNHGLCTPRLFPSPFVLLPPVAFVCFLRCLDLPYSTQSTYLRLQLKMKFTVATAIALAAVANALNIDCAKPCIQEGINKVAPKCKSDIKCACSHSQQIFNTIKPCVISSCGPIPDSAYEAVEARYCK